MEQLLTANVATNLYWLGRYLERVESTLIEIMKASDYIIDVDTKAGVKLFKKFHIKLKYSNSMDFLSHAIRGEHASNFAEIMHNARENSIISRSYIDIDAFGEIIELENLFRNMDNSPLPIDYKDIDTALSLFSEIRGAQSKRGHRHFGDYFLKLGKLVEELDFKIRFNESSDAINSIIKDINFILKILSKDEKNKIKKIEKDADVMATVSNVLNQLIVEE